MQDPVVDVLDTNTVVQSEVQPETQVDVKETEEQVDVKETVVAETKFDYAAKLYVTRGNTKLFSHSHLRNVLRDEHIRSVYVKTKLGKPFPYGFVTFETVDYANTFLSKCKQNGNDYVFNVNQNEFLVFKKYEARQTTNLPRMNTSVTKLFVNGLPHTNPEEVLLQVLNKYTTDVEVVSVTKKSDKAYAIVNVKDGVLGRQIIEDSKKALGFVVNEHRVIVKKYMNRKYTKY